MHLVSSMLLVKEAAVSGEVAPVALSVGNSKTHFNLVSIRLSKLACFHYTEKKYLSIRTTHSYKNYLSYQN